ncbi:MAG: hypothetical protein N4Q32_00695, partial [Neisseriaceae bacterium]|nr:hypothetical protein [Neisseriaceae bacterium]
KESTNWSRMLPELPRKFYETLDTVSTTSKQEHTELIKVQKSIRNWLIVLTGVLTMILLFSLF